VEAVVVAVEAAGSSADAYFAVYFGITNHEV
jgi:hypothetical protein